MQKQTFLSRQYWHARTCGYAYRKSCFGATSFARYQKILFPNNLPIESIRTLRLQGNLPLSNQPDEQAGTAGLTVLTLL